MKFITLILIGFLCCTLSKSYCKNYYTNPRPDINNKELPNDTIKVKGKAFIFFMVSQKEYEKLAKDANSGIDEVLSDFIYYADEVSDTIKQQGFKPIKTESRFIQVILDNNTSITFDRHKEKRNKTGYILTNGKKEPQIDFGVFSDIDFLTILKEYCK